MREGDVGVEIWESLAHHALQHYALLSPQIEFIRHNENITCKATDRDGHQYVLRIHLPVEGFSLATAQHSFTALNGEMEIIKAIGENTDIPMQRPVANSNGWFVTQLENQGQIVYATLLTWVQGKPLDHRDPNWKDQARATGIMTAKLHNFAASWNPGNLERHSYDRAKLDAAIAVLGQGVGMDLFGQEQIEVIRQGGVRIGALMTELDQRREVTWGLVHADLNKGNLIVCKDSVSPIDFCLCGFGYFYMDLGGISADFGPLTVRRAFLEGYRTLREIPLGDIRYIEGFFVMSILLFMATHLHNPQVHQWFQRRIKPICSQYILPLIDGQSFYAEI